ncbi:hypothetical protein AAH991_32405 [Microbispora sp. ZYX-F-249]|uniref:Uncharacterized protein n=1 Tax=Microbispora maris TaxID=3144104 RepID=A0ABV0B1M9_9ACTN
MAALEHGVRRLAGHAQAAADLLLTAAGTAGRVVQHVLAIVGEHQADLSLGNLDARR